MIGKNRIESICRAAGMKPVERGNIEGAQVFVADGFSLPPHRYYRRFGIGPDQFPYGMYTTLWWVSRGEDKLDTGQPLFFDVFHDPSYAKEGRQQMRINAAMQAAKSFLDSRKRATRH